jgi:hypothetical protein
VTARQNGSVTITAYIDNVPGTALITVDQVASRVTVEPPAIALGSGVTHTITAWAYDANDNVIGDATFTWSSSNEEVAIVSSSAQPGELQTAEVTALSTGTVTVEAMSDGVVGTTYVEVNYVVASVDIDPQTATLASIGDTLQLAATVRNEYGDVLSGKTIIWSGPGSVVTVSSSGLVTAVSYGTVGVSATADGISGWATITVGPESPVDVEATSLTQGGVPEIVEWRSMGNRSKPAPRASDVRRSARTMALRQGN